MSDIEIPERLQTTAEKENITLPIDMTVERNYSPEQIDQIAKSGGFLIDGVKMRALHAIGCAAEQLGALRQYKGGVVVTLNGLLSAITKAQGVVEDETDKHTTKEKLEAGRLLGYLAGQLSKLTSGAVKMDRDVAEVVMEADEKRRQSFQPGQAVTRKSP